MFFSRKIGTRRAERKILKNNAANLLDNEVTHAKNIVNWLLGNCHDLLAVLS